MTIDRRALLGTLAFGLTAGIAGRAAAAPTALAGVHLDTGRIAALVGTSGSGKTTLLRMINRLVEPSAGRVLIDGQDTAALAPHLLRRRIGYAIQGHGLFPHRTVGQNIATVPRLLGWPEPEIRARVDELLELFQLDPAQFRDRMDNGRKVAIQILEFFDRHGATLRRGDLRRINPHRLDLFGAQFNAGIGKA